MRTFSPSLALGAILLAGFSGGTSFAQNQSQPATAAPEVSTQARHAHNPHRQAEKMAKKLGLSADQESKLEPILADRAQQMQSVHADTTLAPQDLHARVKSIRQDSDAKVEAILTDTQKQQYEQMKADRKAGKQHHTAAATS